MPQSRMATLDSDMFKCCHKVETLKWNKDTEAHALLQQAADQVKPIMVRRKWTVPLLCEFYPPASNLLGMNHNHGERIEVRLRSPRHHDTFLPYTSVLGTLLHELAHIEVGPHNAAFYALLDDLRAECETLMAATPSSASNAAAGGTALGGAATLPPHLARERAVLAAQRRDHVSRIMPAGGRVLGGDSDLANVAAVCDPREMALAAAERRQADDVWCSAVTSAPSGPSRSSPVVIDVDKDANAVSSNAALDGDDDVVEVVPVSNPKPLPHVVRRPVLRRPRHLASRVRIRENPAALAALQRAEANRPQRR